MVGPKVTLEKIPQLDTTKASVDIDLIGIAKNNNETSMLNVVMSFYQKLEKNRYNTTKRYLLKFFFFIV